MSAKLNIMRGIKMLVKQYFTEYFCEYCGKSSYFRYTPLNPAIWYCYEHERAGYGIKNLPRSWVDRNWDMFEMREINPARLSMTEILDAAGRM